MEKLTSKELDLFYRENEIPLDDFMRERGRTWGSLSYEEKTAIHAAFTATARSRTAATSGRPKHFRPPRFPLYSLSRWGYRPLHGATVHNPSTGRSRHCTEVEYLDVPDRLRWLVRLENLIIRWRA